MTPHIGNTYLLPTGEVGFLDWQVARRGNWSLDLGYFLQGALAIEDRGRSERELLAEYRDALALPANELPSMDEIWLRYRASVRPWAYAHPRTADGLADISG